MWGGCGGRAASATGETMYQPKRGKQSLLLWYLTLSFKMCPRWQYITKPSLTFVLFNAESLLKIGFVTVGGCPVYSEVVKWSPGEAGRIRKNIQALAFFSGSFLIYQGCLPFSRQAGNLRWKYIAKRRSGQRAFNSCR